MSNTNQKDELENTKAEAKGILYTVINGVLKMIVCLFQGRGSHYLYGVGFLITVAVLTRHPLFVVLLVLALLRGVMATGKNNETE